MQTNKSDINALEQNRRQLQNGRADRATVVANLTLTHNGIADISPVLPLPHYDASVPNAIDLPGGNVLLLPAPSSKDDFASSGYMIPGLIFQYCQSA